MLFRHASRPATLLYAVAAMPAIFDIRRDLFRFRHAISDAAMPMPPSSRFSR